MAIRIAVTMGDPSGIGPEILAKALVKWEPGLYQPIIIGSRLALERALGIVGVRLPNLQAASSFLPGDTEAIFLIDPAPLDESDISFAHPSEAACKATLKFIETAVTLAMEGKVQAICTGPIHKANLQKYGFQFPGHTEFLQYLTKAKDVVMMLAGPKLKVSLVTIHEPLLRVPHLLAPDWIRRVIEITAESLIRDFGIRYPRLAVAGLNPHAGEEGQFGHEEMDSIVPAVAAFARVPYSVVGPLPPDTVFYRAYQGEFDAIVAMYHDQGLIPIKLVHFRTAVNVSLGLPIIRTSVDHGTAYDIAGTGRADSESLEHALRLAATMARNRYGRSDRYSRCKAAQS